MRNLARSLVAVVAFATASCTHETADPKEAAAIYMAEFGNPPSADVAGIQCKQVTVRDSDGSWLRFQADGPTLVSLIARGFTRTTSKEFDAGTGGANIPAWWSVDPGMVFYHMEGWNKAYTQSDAWLAYDTRSRLVLFHHGAFD